MMNYLLIILVLGAIILIHEFGHLLAAKVSGIPIRRFSVGFGPRIWGFRRRATDYQLSLIPIGGYVLPEGESEEEYLRYPASRRIIFSLGGPLANMVAAGAGLAAAYSANLGPSFSSLVVQPAMALYRLVAEIFLLLPMLFSAPDQMSGVVGIVSWGGRPDGMTAAALLTFFILLNVNLAFFNMLPLPPLDGGKILFALLEKLYRPLQRLHLPMALTGWLLIISLMLYVTVFDVRRLLG
jgi:regulator of sigma E protease